MTNCERVKTFMTPLTKDESSCEVVDSKINRWIKDAAPEGKAGILVKQITTTIVGSQLITQLLYELKN